MVERVNVADFKGVPSTLFLILWAQYLESKDSNGVCHDSKIIEIVEALDYDFSQYRVNGDARLGVAVRKEIIAEQIQRFVDNNNGGIVVNLGCGLDTYCDRFKESNVLWYDLDLPHVIDLRRRFFSESDHYKMISKSVMDFSWTDEIHCNKRVFVVAEGLLPYFSRSEVWALISHIDKKFADKELLIHAISPWRLRWLHRDMRRASIKLGWGIRSGKEMDGCFADLHFKDEWYVLARFPQRWRWYIRMLSLLPCFFEHEKIIHLAR